MATNVKLHKGDNPTFDDPSLYRQVVGALQYLTLMRPDISFMVNKVCQYMHNPSKYQWVVGKCIPRYLQHTKSMAFVISKASTLALQAFKVETGLAA
ncbi:putative mitochondrial protein [Nicotiana attenuata]|uniref:Mitochondrial protein n=1 Tax=Nicotiana attenuata TaxID=49451 RepID=A0A1J6JWH2_NICAT|nr:putative mitochondrial protein [Nicotiana attenuata]